MHEKYFNVKKIILFVILIHFMSWSKCETNKRIKITYYWIAFETDFPLDPMWSFLNVVVETLAGLHPNSFSR